MTDSKQQLSTSSSSDKANNLFNIDLFSDKPQLEEEAPENKVVSRRLFPFMKKSSIETNDTSAICPIDEEYISKNINENINEDNIEEDVLNESELNFPQIDCDFGIWFSDLDCMGTISKNLFPEKLPFICIPPLHLSEIYYFCMLYFIIFHKMHQEKMCLNSNCLINKF